MSRGTGSGKKRTCARTGIVMRARPMTQTAAGCVRSQPGLSDPSCAAIGGQSARFQHEALTMTQSARAHCRHHACHLRGAEQVHRGSRPRHRPASRRSHVSEVAPVCIVSAVVPHVQATLGKQTPDITSRVCTLEILSRLPARRRFPGWIDVMQAQVCGQPRQRPALLGRLAAHAAAERVKSAVVGGGRQECTLTLTLTMTSLTQQLLTGLQSFHGQSLAICSK